MGQKANPTSLRLGVNRTWDSRWYADATMPVTCMKTLKLKNS